MEDARLLRQFHNRADIRVIQGGSGTRLTFGTLECLLVLSNLPEELQRT